MRFSVNKLRPLGLRYIARDYSAEPDKFPGQLWAYVSPPVRESLHWRLPDALLPPAPPEGLHYYVDTDTHTVVCSNPDLEERYKQECIRFWADPETGGRKRAVPLEDFPFDISWDDEPFDLFG